jgi:PTS system mannose-specific IIA component
VSVGVVLVTHCGLGEQFLEALRLIVPVEQRFRAVSIAADQPIEPARASIRAAVGEVDAGQGVLILTDMFGGTPSNLALSLLSKDAAVEVVTGVNLPMVIKLATLRDEKALPELARFIKEYGRRNISVASELLPEDPT